MDRCEVCGDLAPRYRMGCLHITDPSLDWHSPYCTSCIDLTLLQREVIKDAFIAMLVKQPDNTFAPATVEEVKEVLDIQSKCLKSYYRYLTTKSHVNDGAE